jgi:hypothetical protein
MPTGVYKTTKKDNSTYYRVSITYQSRHISLGSFDDYDTANNVYIEATRILREPCCASSFYINTVDYTTGFSNCQSELSFEKFVLLVNLRDNDMYVKTPIYLCHRFFLYFLSEKTVLKFDIEDLFYYSSHKIMSRGGYFFVNDFGMQTSILNRFGIRNHSVKGKDYQFRNGDEHDFRYSNVAIINRYYGVEQAQKNGRVVYKTRIHINGNYSIGTYSSENEAAIAYNRAVDLLLEKCPGIKDFQKNYIESLSYIEYASLYNNVKISKKFRRYIETL